MLRTYESWKPNADAQAVIRQAASIITEYAEQGFDLTLRQLYYQFVARDLIPNNLQSYKRLGDIINKARYAGFLPWDRIVDRTRNMRQLAHFGNPQGVINAAAASYGLDLWEDQDVRVEVWVEKEALAGIVQRAAEAWDCPWFSCRGYVSSSELWGAARRFARYLEPKPQQRIVILHLGDHDPSGIDMTRDMEDRLNKFIAVDWLNDNASHLVDDTGSTTRGAIWDDISEGTPWEGETPLEIRRIALNYDQVLQYEPPPNPAKLTDSRARGYIAEHGYESWELDALDPRTLDDLIQSNIEGLVDLDRFTALRERQEEERQLIIAAARDWPRIAAELNRQR